MLAWIALLAFTGCGRYADFTLPSAGNTAEAGAYVWEPRPQPVLARGPDSVDQSDALNPSVVRHQHLYFNFYSGFDGRTWHTALATSNDGITWTKRGKLLSPEGWEGDYIAANGSALRFGNEFLYWYQAGRTPQIALARSSGGTTWRKHGVPVLPVGPRGSWDERGAADPYVIQVQGTLYMFYLGQDRAMRQRLGVARSADGITWTKLRENPLLELGEFGEFDENGLGEPAVWQAHGSYWMLYTGRDRAEHRRMGLARSQDGVRWQKLKSPILQGDGAWNAKVICDATVELDGPDVRVWFGGGDRASPDERLNGQIGLAMLRWRSEP